MNSMDTEIVKGSSRERFILIFIITIGLLLAFCSDYFAQLLFSQETPILKSNPDLALERMELKLNIFLIISSSCFGLMFYYSIKHGIRAITSRQFPPQGMSVPFDTKAKKGNSAICNGIMMLVISIIPLIYICGAIWVWINI